MEIVVGIEAPKCTAWDVRNLELSRPLRRAGREPRVHRSERGDDLVGERVFRHYEEVDVAAVLGEITGREGAVEIHADELRSERAADACKQLREHSVNVGVTGRLGNHHCRQSPCPSTSPYGPPSLSPTPGFSTRTVTSPPSANAPTILLSALGPLSGSSMLTGPMPAMKKNTAWRPGFFGRLTNVPMGEPPLYDLGVHPPQVYAQIPPT